MTKKTCSHPRKLLLVIKDSVKCADYSKHKGVLCLQCHAYRIVQSGDLPLCVVKGKKWRYPK